MSDMLQLLAKHKMLVAAAAIVVGSVAIAPALAGGHLALSGATDGLTDGGLDPVDVGHQVGPASVAGTLDPEGKSATGSASLTTDAGSLDANGAASADLDNQRASANGAATLTTDQAAAKAKGALSADENGADASGAAGLKTDSGEAKLGGAAHVDRDGNASAEAKLGGNLDASDLQGSMPTAGSASGVLGLN